MAEETQNQSSAEETKSTEQQSTTTQQSEKGITEEALKARLQRAEKSAVRKFLEGLGVDEATLKAKLQTPVPEPDNTALTKLEALEQQFATLRQETEAAKKERDELKAKERRTATVQAIQSATAHMRQATIAEDIYMLLGGTGYDFNKLLDDDMKPKADELKALVDKAREMRPSWFKGGGPGIPSSQGGTPAESGQQKQAKKEAADFHRQIIKRGF